MLQTGTKWVQQDMLWSSWIDPNSNCCALTALPNHSCSLCTQCCVIWHLLTIENFVVRWWRRWGFVWTCWPALSLLSEPISIFEVNGEHKTYLKATFTTWLIPLHCVISRCHISPPHVCLNAPPSSLWLVRVYWLPKFTCSMMGIAHNLISTREKLSLLPLDLIYNTPLFKL